MPVCRLSTQRDSRAVRSRGPTKRPRFAEPPPPQTPPNGRAAHRLNKAFGAVKGSHFLGTELLSWDEIVSNPRQRVLISNHTCVAPVSAVPRRPIPRDHTRKAFARREAARNRGSRYNSNQSLPFQISAHNSRLKSGRAAESKETEEENRKDTTKQQRPPKCQWSACRYKLQVLNR